MESRLAPMCFAVQSDVDFRVYEVYLNAPWSPCSCVCHTLIKTAEDRSSATVIIPKHSRGSAWCFIPWQFSYKHLPTSVPDNFLRFARQTENLPTSGSWRVFISDSLVHISKIIFCICCAAFPIVRLKKIPWIKLSCGPQNLEHNLLKMLTIYRMSHIQCEETRPILSLIWGRPAPLCENMLTWPGQSSHLQQDLITFL